MQILENKIPPPLVAALFAVMIWIASQGSPLYFPFLRDIDGGIRYALIGLVFILGLFFCIGGVISFSKAKTTVNPLVPGSATSLVSSGVYKISRNPMYLGFALFLVGWGIYLSSVWAAFGLVGFILYMNRFQVMPEERVLTDIFGPDFVEYQKRVRRWL